MKRRQAKTIRWQIDYKAVMSAMREIFSKRNYVILAALLSVLFFVVAALLPTYGMLKFAFLSGYLTLANKFAVLWDAFAMFGLAYSAYQTIIIIIGVVLAGINFSMLVYLIKKQAGVAKTSGMSIVGVVFGSLGLGCSACGSFVLSSFLGVTGAAGLIGGLPLRGGEFGLAAIVFMAISIHALAKKIKAPMVCKS